MSSFKRGEVYQVYPDPSIGKEQKNPRPCVIVSADLFNSSSDLCVVCPITEGMKLSGDIIHIPISRGEGGSTKDCIVLCDQVKAVDQGRLMEKRGNLHKNTMQKIDKGLREILVLY
jgi:mRNA interferase MazF